MRRTGSGRINNDNDNVRRQENYEDYLTGDYTTNKDSLREPYMRDADADDKYLDSLIDRIDTLEDSRRQIRNPQGQRYNNVESRNNIARQGMVRRGPVSDASYTRNADSRRSNSGRGSQYTSSSNARRSPGQVEFGGENRQYPISQQRDSYGYGSDRRNGNFLDRRRNDLGSSRNYDNYGDEYGRDQRYSNNDGYGRRGRGDMNEYDRDGRNGNRRPKISKTLIGYLTSYSLHIAFVLVVLFPLVPEFLKSFPK